MLAPECRLPVWWLAFNRFRAVEFSDEDLFAFVMDELRRSSSWEPPLPSSVRKDVDCLLRMYAPHAAGRFALDDILDCPFRELGLVERVWDDRKRFRVVLGPKPTLPPAVLMYACVDYMVSADAAAQTITITRLVQEIGSPGLIFKLTEEALVKGLEDFSRQHSHYRVRSLAGVPQLAVDGVLRERAAEALRAYYEAAGHRVGPSADLGLEATVVPQQLPTVAAGIG
jgi:hypothetical protein